MFDTDREEIEADIFFRQKRYGYHPHCRGCENVETCGVVWAAHSEVECSHRPGPMFAQFQSGGAKGQSRGSVGVEVRPPSLTHAVNGSGGVR
jgi:hypothetical protein